MRLTTLAFVILVLLPATGFGQVGGNINYGGGAAGPTQALMRERALRQVTRDEMPPTDSSVYLDAGILMNVRADQFVATFGVAEEGETIAEAQGRMDRTVALFTEAVRPLGVVPEALFVDFTAQTKIYKYDIENDVARERLVGFEIKKTVAVRYRDKLLIDRLVTAASLAKVYDLIKVDYIVSDLAPIQERLADEAARVLRAKIARHERLLGVHLRAVPQIIVERTATHFPTDQYDSATAAETENVTGYDRSQLIRQPVRRSRTFFFHPLTGDGFDQVVEPVILEPVVQFSYYLKLRYEIENRR